MLAGLRWLTQAKRADPERFRRHQEAVRRRTEESARLAREHGTRYSLYTFRHTACTRMLTQAKLEEVTASVLLGHRDTTTISRHYAHPAQRPEHLREAANSPEVLVPLWQGFVARPFPGDLRHVVL